MNWFTRLIGRGDTPQPAAAVMRPAPPRAAPAAPTAAPIENLPVFRASAAEQLSATRGGLLDKVRLRLRDAFTPSQPVMDPAMFAGRATILATLIRALEDQRLHVVLFGDRGIGKTSMLHIVTRQARDARYLVHYASCGEEADFNEMFRGVAEALPLRYHAGYSPIDGEQKDASMASLLPAGPVTPRVISDLFARLTGTRLLVILDEFDRSPQGGFRRQVAELVKTLSDRSIRVQLVIAGVASDLTELVELIPSIRRNILGLPMPSMAADEVTAMIRNGERVSGVTFDEAAVQTVVTLAAGSPYIAGLLAQHAGIIAVDRGSTTIAPQDVAQAIGRAAEEIGARISERSRYALDRATADGHRAALADLAHAALRNGGRFDGAAITDPAATAETRAAAITRAADDYGLIERVPTDPAGRHRFREEGVPIYLWMSVARENLA